MSESDDTKATKEADPDENRPEMSCEKEEDMLGGGDPYAMMY